MENKVVKVGDIFTSTWGYEQTNRNFYQVVALNGKTMVTLREIGAEFVRSDTAMSGYLKPKKDVFVGDEVRRKAHVDGGDVWVKLNTVEWLRPCSENGEYFFSSWY